MVSITIVSEHHIVINVFGLQASREVGKCSAIILILQRGNWGRMW